MKSPRRATLALTLLAALLLAGPQAHAQDWNYQLTPYFWGIGLDGDVGVGGLPPVGFETSFSDVWDSFETGFAAVFTARRDRWIFLADGSWLELSQSGMAGPYQAELDTDSALGTLMIGTQIGSPIDCEVYAGGRYMYMRNALDIRDVGSASDKQDWVDPLVGARFDMALTGKLTLAVFGSVGGFGVASDLTWEAMPVLGYRISDRLSIHGGYRWMDVDYEDGGFVYDVMTQGWLAGLGLRF